MTPKASCEGRDTARKLVRRSGNVVSLTIFSIGPAPAPKHGPWGESVAKARTVARMLRAFSDTACGAGERADSWRYGAKSLVSGRPWLASPGFGPLIFWQSLARAAQVPVGR